MPTDAGSISFLMIGKSWFPDWNEYGKDLYPALDSRSPLISCPRGAYRELLTRCKRYLLPCSALRGQHGGCDSSCIIYYCVVVSHTVIDNKSVSHTERGAAVRLPPSPVSSFTCGQNVYQAASSTLKRRLCSLFIRGKHIMEMNVMCESDLAQRLIFTLQIDVVH